MGISTCADPVDAIGSVANYFKAHGWVKGDQVAVMANGQAPGLPNGFKTRYSISQLAAAGLTPQQPLGNHQQASLLASGCRYRLPVLVRSAELLHHYPL